jgi:hypothetical protein
VNVKFGLGIRGGGEVLWGFAYEKIRIEVGR